MQSTIDKLKEKPKEQKTAVAGGIATVVVAVLLIGWGFYYLKKVLAERPVDEFTSSGVDYGALRDTNEDAAAMGGSNYGMEGSSASPFGESRENF